MQIEKTRKCKWRVELVAVLVVEVWRDELSVLLVVEAWSEELSNWTELCTTANITAIFIGDVGKKVVLPKVEDKSRRQGRILKVPNNIQIFS